MKIPIKTRFKMKIQTKKRGESCTMKIGMRNEAAEVANIHEKMIHFKF